MRTQYDQLIDSSVSTHGFWLINHQSIIGGELLEAIEKKGLQNAILELNDARSELSRTLYRKIEKASV